MEVVAHGLWAAAAVVAGRNKAALRVGLWPAVWWAAFPDVLTFGTMGAYGLWLRMTGGAVADHGHMLPHAHIGLPLYQAGHSVLVWLVAFAAAWLLMRRAPLAMLGWALHIAIDIPTHSFSYYATRFLWPVSDFRVDGIAWWTPWFWTATYISLAAVYGVLWSKGWLATSRRTACTGPLRVPSPHRPGE